MNMTSYHFSRGFTLIETMVAVTILTLAVAGPLMTASRAIVAAQSARDQLTASYLAQEGIEYVRAMRDNEYLAAIFFAQLLILLCLVFVYLLLFLITLIRVC